MTIIFIGARGKGNGVEITSVGNVSVQLRTITADKRDEGAVLLSYDAVGLLIEKLEEMRRHL